VWRVLARWLLLSEPRLPQLLLLANFDSTATASFTLATDALGAACKAQPEENWGTVSKVRLWPI
jgi:hypothetical protein